MSKKRKVKIPKQPFEKPENQGIQAEHKTSWQKLKENFFAFTLIIGYFGGVMGFFYVGWKIIKFIF